MSDYTHPPSPRWGATLKIIVGLSFALAMGAILISFRSIIGPLLLAIILAYFIHPLAARLNSFTSINWRLSVTLVYLVVIVILVGFFTASGFALGGQIESLYNTVRNFVNNQLPMLIDEISQQSFVFGPFQFDLSQFNISDVVQQVLNNIQSVIGQASGLIGALASGAAEILGWAAFVLLVSYFLVAEAGRMPDALRYVTIPGYDYDIRRISRELGRTWNAYLRGQFLIIFLVILASATLLSILGVRYALALALLTGLARFVPYVGPLVVNLILFLVAAFQGSNYFGLQQFYFAIIVVILAIVLDQFFDNVVTPRLLGETLGVHPAAVLVAALILAQFIGFVGLILAAPVLASLRLISRYLLRKLFDLDPWPEPEAAPSPIELPWEKVYGFIRTQFLALKDQIQQRRKKTPPESDSESDTAS